MYVALPPPRIAVSPCVPPPFRTPSEPSPGQSALSQDSNLLHFNRYGPFSICSPPAHNKQLVKSCILLILRTLLALLDPRVCFKPFQFMRLRTLWQNIGGVGVERVVFHSLRPSAFLAFLLFCLPASSSPASLRPLASSFHDRFQNFRPIPLHEVNFQFSAKPMSRIAAILPAAGLGTRMGAETPKQFLELEGAPIVVHTLRRIASCPLVTEIYVATRADEVARFEERIRGERFKQPVRVVRGGDSRQASVAQALREVPDTVELVLVHDAVRPFVTREQIERVIEEARRRQAAILGVPAMDTVKEVKRASLPEDVALITATVPRERVVLAQTPQVFATKLLKEAFARAEQDGVNTSDEAGLVERLGHDVYVVLGSERNIKITRPSDMDLARFYFERDRDKP